MATKYGKWTIIRQLTEGGQAHTFLVECAESPGDEYVLKRLKNVNRLGRFRQEVEAASKLSHPNLLPVVDHDLDGVKPYLVSPYCAGGSLAQADLGELCTTDKLLLFKGICEGVAYAHEKGIIHRDLKPENVFLKDDRETPVVGDFGICFVADSGERFTLIEEAVGSRFYIAPELEDGRADLVSAASDVYSLGKLLHWLMVGKAFSREKHHDQAYDLARLMPASEGFLINELLDRMIVADPNERYAGADELLEEVRRLIRRIEMKAHPISLKAPQECSYCGIGRYRVVVDYQQDVSGNATQVKNFGFSPVGMSVWLILACDHCGNVQIFRPDEADDRSIWRK
jgi:serine/threonine protein kinase